MAKDDYHVIVYQILAYLYQCLKHGERVEEKHLKHNSKYFQINESYWEYIIYNMQTEGLITGIVFVEIDGKEFPYPTELDKCMITPIGIEYLCDNRFVYDQSKTVFKRYKRNNTIYING